MPEPDTMMPPVKNRVLSRLQPRWVWIVAGILLAAAGVAAVVWARVGTPALQGAVVTPPAPTYDFSLHDPDNKVVRLSALRGKAVVLTFLYAHCPDVCPLTAEKLHETYRQLGGTANRVALLAVSVDPKGDTPEAVRTFLTTHHVTGELSYLTGSYAELKRVWSYYYVSSNAKDTPPKTVDLVDHTSVVYVIDPSGNLRVFLPGNFDPKDLTTDLKILASEPAR
jgi:protein SCO1